MVGDPCESSSRRRLPRQFGGDRPEAIFVGDADRATFLAIVARALHRFDTLVLTHCLMGNHYHLVLCTRLGKPLVADASYQRGLHARLQSASRQGRACFSGALQGDPGRSRCVPARTMSLRRAQPRARQHRLAPWPMGVVERSRPHRAVRCAVLGGCARIDSIHSRARCNHGPRSPRRREALRRIVGRRAERKGVVRTTACATRYAPATRHLSGACKHLRLALTQTTATFPRCSAPLSERWPIGFSAAKVSSTPCTAVIVAVS